MIPLLLLFAVSVSAHDLCINENSCEQIEVLATEDEIRVRKGNIMLGSISWLEELKKNKNKNIKER